MKLSHKFLLYGTVMIIMVAMYAPAAKAGQKDFIGINWGPISGSEIGRASCRERV